MDAEENPVETSITPKSFTEEHCTLRSSRRWTGLGVHILAASRLPFPRMKPRRKIFAAVALVAGLALVYFEIARHRGAGAWEFNFWIVVGALLIFFALIDLFSKPAGPS